MALHIVKLVVGFDSLNEFARWQAHERVCYKGQMANIVRTRYQPKDAEKILAGGGSIYRVIKSSICCRQKILGFDTFESATGTKCAILTDTEIIRTYAAPKRAFQGWRYLKQEDAPTDIGPYVAGEDDIPEAMEAELIELGLL